MLAQPVGPLRAAEGAHERRARVGLARLASLVSDAVVAHHRCGEADELLGVARIGNRLLVPGHPGREDGLAERDAVRGDGATAEDGAVLEDEITAAHRSNTSRPPATVFATCPWSVSPRSHELAESERKPSSVTVHSTVEVEDDEVRAPHPPRSSARQVERSRRPR